MSAILSDLFPMKWIITFFITLLSTSAVASNQPNVIFILTDDLGYSDISCFGAKTVKTPHIDKLAEKGLKFTDFHTGASICSPSRAAFLTGAYPQRSGLYMGINPNRTAHWFLGLHPDEVTLAEQFLTKDYATHMIGKWHLGTEPEFLPRKQGFQTYYGMPCNFGHTPEFYDDDELVHKRTPLDQLTKLYTDRANKIIRESSKTEKPFFLYFSHNYPHTPFQASAQFKGSSKGGKRGDMMQELDWGIGEMMRTLSETGQAENTIVIFTSDNGSTSPAFTKPYRGTKYVSFEGGHRVPFIIHWPKAITEARESTLNIHAMDLFPTLSEIIEAPLPKDRIYDGVSILPTFTGGGIARDESIPFFYYNCENLQAIRVGDWKLHLPRKKNQLPFWEKNKVFANLKTPVLYNLKTDLAEATDVAKANPEVVAQLLALAQPTRAQLGEFMQRGSAQRPTGSLFPAVPVVSHEKDWATVPAETAKVISDERTVRHPDHKKPKARQKKK